MRNAAVAFKALGQRAFMLHYLSHNVSLKQHRVILTHQMLPNRSQHAVDTVMHHHATS